MCFWAAVSNGGGDRPQRTDHSLECKTNQRGRRCVYSGAVWCVAVILGQGWFSDSLVYMLGKPQHIWLHTGCTDWLPICLKGNATRTNCFFTTAVSNPLVLSYYYLTIISGHADFDSSWCHWSFPPGSEEAKQPKSKNICTFVWSLEAESSIVLNHKLLVTLIS